MNSRQLRALRKDKVARKFAALAEPDAPPVEMDEAFFQRSDLETLAAKEVDSYGTRNEARAMDLQVRRQAVADVIGRR